jgi:hypothetical protein
MAANNTYELYIYLARRDKSSVRILMKVIGNPVLATRITDISLLNLPAEKSSKISQIIYNDRMLWEPWIEAASTFENLRAALKARGYTNIPMSPQPEIISTNGISSVTTSSLPKQKTMIRKI